MALKSTPSMQSLAQSPTLTAHLTSHITKEIFVKTSNFSIFFSLFLANSKGKDKFIALFQYLFQFFISCGKNSNIPEFAEAFKRRELSDMIVYYNLKESISSARKVFRLFRFFDEIKGLTKILKTDKPMGFKLLSVFTYLCSTTYYISDNILWLFDVFVRSKIMDKIHRRNWKYRKNFSSLMRIIAYTLILIYSIYLQEKDNHKSTEFLHRQGQAAEPNIQAEEKAYNQILDGRRKIRFFLLQLCLSFFRFFMLVNSLKLRYHQKLDPIFVGACGLCSAILGLIKALFEKKIVINIESKDGKEVESKVTMSRLKRIQSIESSKFW